MTSLGGDAVAIDNQYSRVSCAHTCDNPEALLCTGTGADAEVREASEALPLKRASFGMGGRRLNFLPLRESLNKHGPFILALASRSWDVLSKYGSWYRTASNLGQAYLGLFSC